MRASCRSNWTPQGHGGAERVHVAEVDGVGDGAFDDHSSCVSIGENVRGLAHLAGDEDGGRFVSKFGAGDLADELWKVSEVDVLVEDGRLAVDGSDIGEGDAVPLLVGG